MNEFQSKEQRIDDLLAERALAGLAPEEQAELQQLLAGIDVDVETCDRAAARIAVALNPGPFEPLPAALRIRIAKEAAGHLVAAAGAQTSTPRVVEVERFVPNNNTPTRVALPREIFAWFTAAACLLIAAISWWHLHPTPTPASATPTFAESRKLLIEKSSDLVKAPWDATEDPTAKGAAGDVVWSNARQAGFLRFKGLAANDPQRNQYQLWIFDANQDERYPIDGGVFNVEASSVDPQTGDVIVPIHAKLRVVDPKMFAVTVEKPGGVVVSSRKRISLLAKTPAGQG